MLNKLYIIIIIIILIIIVIKVQYYFKTIEEFTTILYVADDRPTGKYGFTCSKCICDPGKYRSGGCNGLENSVCSPCSSMCPGGHYRVEGTCINGNDYTCEQYTTTNSHCPGLDWPDGGEGDCMKCKRPFAGGTYFMKHPGAAGCNKCIAGDPCSDGTYNTQDCGPGGRDGTCGECKRGRCQDSGKYRVEGTCINGNDYTCEPYTTTNSHCPGFDWPDGGSGDCLKCKRPWGGGNYFIKHPGAVGCN